MSYYETNRRAQAARIDPRRLRKAMVRDQIQARGIAHPGILAAMSEIPRHQFVQDALALHAYDDTALPIGYGQTISQPYMVARMSELLQPEAGMRILEIGSGSGYQAAVLAWLGCSVYGIERVKEIYQAAVARLRRLGFRRVHLHYGDGTLGMPQAAPFDRIIVSAGGPAVPPPLLEQLAEGGILLIPVGQSRGQRLVRIFKNNGKFEKQDLGGAIFVDLIGNHGWHIGASSKRY